MTIRRPIAFVALFIALTAIVIGVTVTSCGHKRAPNGEALRVQFGWLPDTHHVGFWLAAEKGYYRDEGLEVELRAGGLDSSPLTSVVSGAAEIGQVGGMEQLVTARAEGLPVRAVASFHRTTP